MKRNHDILSPTPEAISWRFRLRSDADTASDVTDELLGYLRTVLDAAEELYRPMEVDMPISCFPPEVNPSDTFETVATKRLRTHLLSPSHQDRFAVRADNPITYGDLMALVEGFQCPNGTLPYIRMVKLLRGDTHIRLADGDHWISIDSDRYRAFEDGVPVDEPPSIDPIKIELHHRRGFSDRTESYYDLEIRSNTAIWLEETEIGDENRKRLSRFLRSIYNLSGVESLETGTDDHRFSDDVVRELAIGPTE
ncbi:hypothetical protein ACFQH3_08695 [Haladaptatus sp. GCM10025707]|uniref:hypothetical protein n=1 Tax=unclassified Haladaptatus TaxID=2622732 RepID=UPI0023E86208|nr:hypothetical protein [Haladaptatus sp. QDMS2]